VLDRFLDGFERHTFNLAEAAHCYRGS